MWYVSVCASGFKDSTQAISTPLAAMCRMMDYALDRQPANGHRTGWIHVDASRKIETLNPKP